ncbi:MAG: hypothetical protein A2X08_04940 [Bacteroidetes bacterium GWA2_32_17]|nr:MAG: hypothetical protein A2X08_04940 [Bacteroidetes bacterium GWA2_32_17]
MTEDFLHFVWQFGLFERTNLKALTGEDIDIISTGQHNTDSGPDFFNARIKINRIEWAGNVEIHIKSSDWKKHGHTNDKAYNNVILHVVSDYDADVFINENQRIPTIKLNYNKILLENYKSLYGSVGKIPCSRHLNKINTDFLKFYLPSLAIERLEQKTQTIKKSLINNKFNWEETFYIAIARNFGFRINSQPFTMLAESIPLKVLAKQKNNLLQIEAILFGQSGLVPKTSEHTYVKSLIGEYVFLKSKFSLTPLELSIWKYLRVRPLSFPSIRIAQFAVLIHQSSALLSKIIEQNELESLIKLFSLKASSYWDEHYDFDKPSPNEPKTLGNDSINTIIINTVIPFLFLYGREKGKDEISERALKFLELLPAEKNTIIKQFADYNIKAKNALESQSLIQLYNNYCIPRNCLKCQIGCKIIQATNKLI